MSPEPFPASAQWSAVSPSYDWQRHTEEHDIDYVYHGRVENLPPSTSKIVRIFLSSTFTDTTTERNLLMKNVFPDMRRYCRDKYDVDFQVRTTQLGPGAFLTIGTFCAWPDTIVHRKKRT